MEGGVPFFEVFEKSLIWDFSASSCPKYMIKCALKSPWPILSIWALYEHLRALYEHLWALSYTHAYENAIFWWKVTFLLQHMHAHRCSYDAHGCSQALKTQSTYSALFNAQSTMFFRSKLDDISPFEIWYFFTVFSKMQFLCHFHAFFRKYQKINIFESFVILRLFVEKCCEVMRFKAIESYFPTVHFTSTYEHFANTYEHLRICMHMTFFEKHFLQNFRFFVYIIIARKNS